jgi:alkanesulfonate monooxygenase SsuD/methylene tetrahydromethanopterin reductase-like flavin-dependent oxidoreductase (luciferase family)
MRVGVGLLPVPLRNVALTAMEVATLHRLFPGRVNVGVGHGVQDWMAQVGARVESPITLLREYLTALRALLAGERVSVEGRYVRLADVALDWPPARPRRSVRRRHRTTRCEALRRVADGTISTGGTPPDGLRSARRLVDEAPPPPHRRAGHRLPSRGHWVRRAAASRGERERCGYVDAGQESPVTRGRSPAR